MLIEYSRVEKNIEMIPSLRISAIVLMLLLSMKLGRNMKAISEISYQDMRLSVLCEKRSELLQGDQVGSQYLSKTGSCKPKASSIDGVSCNTYMFDLQMPNSHPNDPIFPH